MPKRKVEVGSNDATPHILPKRKRVRSSQVSEALNTDVPSCVAASPEKRLARFKPHCPQNILDRVDRVMSQRFFLVHRERNGGELCEKFHVLGSTGNVYEVTIDKVPACTCPDANKGNHCKHILFIFLKVLNVPMTSPHYYQKALLTDELREIFEAAPANPTVIASQRVRDAYAVAKGSAVPPKVEGSDMKRKDPNGEDCAICYERIEGNIVELEKVLVWCDTCQNAVHKECFGQWSATAQSSGSKLTCVYCRTPWPESTAAGTSKEGIDACEGVYMNLAGVAGLSMERDTTSYYRGRHGTASWKRYGWH
ncbi:uncharacterized protein EI90DRAFT_3279067 [Cantharellus anzutake]|uniref:uncharacterized protein n=1 Tax=Cantharellus anzutake TaxID=1750568 RepID=UPI0019059642|nr:uncharacterized protein EI90DRAFT_3279067 [Cantharellus anzutake]KAF8340340.1 hypothetical protein EI90DRAFT_3279067 [Cantharellus anzutake]